MNDITLLLNSHVNDLDMLIFTEVNVKNIVSSYDESEFSVNNYSMFSRNFMKQGFRGIICYVKSNFISTVIDLGDCFKEYLCLRVKGILADSLFLIVYRSPHSNDNNDKNLILLLKLFLSLKGIHIIVGDFNFPCIDWAFKSTFKGLRSIELKLLNFVNDNFLFQVVNEPTRYRGSQRSNLLDLILVKDQDFIDELDYIAPLGKSDHCVICFRVCNINCNSIEDVDFPKLNFNKGDYVSMNNFIMNNL